MLFAVAGPTNVRSLQLWLDDQSLAFNTGWGLTFASFLAFAVVRYAAKAEPMVAPWRDLKWLSWVRFPTPTVMIGALLVGGLLWVQLLGAWNYYLHDQLRNTGASTIAIEASAERVANARKALASFEERAARASATADSVLARTADNAPTGASRLVTASAGAAAAQREERRELQGALDEALGAMVRAQQTMSDRRPVDAQLAGMFGVSRPVMASANDLQRSGLVEVLLVMGAALSLVGATSRLGVRREDAPPAEDGARDDDEPDEPTAVAGDPPPANDDDPLLPHAQALPAADRDG